MLYILKNAITLLRLPNDCYMQVTGVKLSQYYYLASSGDSPSFLAQLRRNDYFYLKRIRIKKRPRTTTSPNKQAKKESTFFSSAYDGGNNLHLSQHRMMTKDAEESNEEMKQITQEENIQVCCYNFLQRSLMKLLPFCNPKCKRDEPN